MSAVFELVGILDMSMFFAVFGFGFPVCSFEFICDKEDRSYLINLY